MAGAAGIGSSAAKRGVSPAETLGALATLSDPMGSVDVAATRLRSLFDAAERLGLEGGSLSGLLSGVQAKMQKSGESALKTLGSSEATQAFDLLTKNQAAVDSAVQAIRAASTGRVLDERIMMLERDPLQGLGISRRAAVASLEAAQMSVAADIGQKEQIRDAIAAKAQEVRLHMGVGGFGRALFRARRAAAETLFGEVNEFPDIGIARAREMATEQGNSALLRSVNELADLQRQATEIAKRQEERERKKTAKPSVPVPES
jgi:hypothetical protein